MRSYIPHFILFSQLESEPGKSEGFTPEAIDALVQRPECDVISLRQMARVECR